MTASDFIEEVNSVATAEMNVNPHIRKGQALFNAVYDLYPYIADEIRGSDTDCFYNDKRIDLFLSHVITIYDRDNEN